MSAGESPLPAAGGGPSLEELEAELLLLESLRDDTGSAAPEEPIGPAPRDRPLVLSSGQRRLWFVHQLAPGNPAYNMPVALELLGELDHRALRAALDAVVRRHESLRTVFATRGGEPRQVVLPPAPARLIRIDLSRLPEDAAARRLAALARREAARPFDLDHGPLFRASLVELGPRHRALLVTVHHIVSDGWSMEVLVRELVAGYRSSVAGARRWPEPLPIQFPDYARWEQEQLRRGAWDRQLGYWRRQLAGAPPLLRLPTDRPRPPEQSYRGGAVTRSLPPALGARVRSCARDAGTTPFSVLLATFQLLLHRLSGQDDLLVGTDVANRPRPETEGLIGFFVNNVALRSRIGDDPSFRRHLRRVHDTCLEGLAHQELPLERLIDELRVPRSLAHAPFFQVLFVMQNYPVARTELPKLEIRPLTVPVESSKFDLALFVSEVEDGYRATWIYRTDLFDQGRVESVTAAFETLLEGALADPETPVQELPMIKDQDIEEGAAGTPGSAPSPFGRFRRVRPQTVRLPSREMVRRDFLEPGVELPLQLTPAVEHLDLVDWAAAHKEELGRDLDRYGAVLFRGFAVASPAEFERFAAAVCDRLYDAYGDLPKEKSAERIYRSTPYPPDRPILFHNESSHLDRWPSRQMFHCVTAAEEGGETPIVDCRELHRALDPEIAELFERKGLLYRRNFTEGLDVGWRDFYRTEDRAEVERRCRAEGTEWEWTDDGLRTRQRCRAVIRHPRTGEKCFFNQLQLHHPSRLDPEVRRSLLEIFGPDDLPRDVRFGDDTPIEDSLVEELTQLCWRLSRAFRWREGDVLLVDNMLVAHARNPFRGDRKIVVAMGDMIEAESV